MNKSEGGTAQNEQLIKLIQEISQNEELLRQTNIKILEFRKHNSLDDIFLNFLDAEALDKGIATIKNMGLDKPRMIVLDNKTEIKMNLMHALHKIEGILQEKVWEDIYAQNLHCLISKKIFYEIRIATIMNEVNTIKKNVNKSIVEPLDVIVSQFDKILI